MSIIKGTIDITVLMVSVVSLALMLALATYTVADRNTKASLYAEISYNENRFQAIQAHSAILDSETRRKIGFLRHRPFREDEWSGQIEGRAENVLKAHSSIYEFSASNEQIEMESDQEGSNARISTYIASPGQDGVRAVTVLGRPKSELLAQGAAQNLEQEQEVPGE